MVGNSGNELFQQLNFAAPAASKNKKHEKDHFNIRAHHWLGFAPGAAK
jgi:hypothetical protein